MQLFRPWMQQKDFDLFLAVNMWKCPDWNGTRTRSVASPTKCIYQVVSNRYLKICRKMPGKLKKHHAKTIAKIPTIKFCKKQKLCWEVYSGPPTCRCQIWRIYLDLWGYDCKKRIWSPFGYKVRKIDPNAMKLKPDMSCHLLTMYIKSEIDMLTNTMKNPNGRTDRRSDIAMAYIIGPFFKRPYKKYGKNAPNKPTYF